MIRLWSLAALVAGIWLLSAYGQSRPDVLGPDAPDTQFSAGRTGAVLARVLGPQQPHPAGSEEGQRVRARILKELAAMNVPAHTQTGMSCYSAPRWRFLPCGSVTNIIAEVSPGSGKTVLLMAHADSVAAGPGAADDGSGVAILLETIRALKARGGGTHPVVALFTDGEEVDLLGAAFYLRDPVAKAGIGAVINVEARGNEGPSYLFQTSGGNARLIDLYAAGVTHYATSSLYQEIYKRLPNDTDLTPMLGLSVPAYNFAFIGNSAHYHTPLDRQENIDPRSLQQQGEAALAVADGLRKVDLTQLKSGDAIYLDVLGRWLPRLPEGWALPLSVAVFVLIALSGWREWRGWKQAVTAAAMPPLLIAACVGIGFVLHGLAVWISGQADPSFAHPVWLRLSLAFAAFAAALVTARRAGAIWCWLWFAGLAIVCSLAAPGLTPYFLFPSLVAAPLLLVTVKSGRGAALLVSALIALVIWIGLNQGGEPIMGLKLHPLFMVSAAFGLLSLLPLMAKAKGWKPTFIVSLVLSLTFAVVAGLQPAYSERAPQRLNLRYAERDGRAFWLADAVARLPDRLRKAANFAASPQDVKDLGRFYVAPAGRVHLDPPHVIVRRAGNQVGLETDTAADGFILLVPAQARLQRVTLNGVQTVASDGALAIGCATPDCGHARLSLQFDAGVIAPLLLETYRQGLPSEGANLLAARPPDTVPSQGGDRTVLVTKVTVPER
jgi:hypothetical protein